MKRKWSRTKHNRKHSRKMTQGIRSNLTGPSDREPLILQEEQSRQKESLPVFVTQLCGPESQSGGTEQRESEREILPSPLLL